MKFIKLSTLLIICLCLTGIAQGQETTGVIEGTVVDAQGARVAGATVLVEGNAFSRTVITDAEGRYRIIQVPAGNYSITTSATNFTTEKSENVKVTLGRATTADITLNAGQVSANVVVTAADVAAIAVAENAPRFLGDGLQLEVRRRHGPRNRPARTGAGLTLMRAIPGLRAKFNAE